MPTLAPMSTVCSPSSRGSLSNLIRELADEEGLSAAGGFFEDDGEFVAAGAGYGIGAANTRGEQSAATRCSTRSPT